MIGKGFPAKKEPLISQEKSGERIRLFINEKKKRNIFLLAKLTL
jgi:hypothetical protein